MDAGRELDRLIAERVMGDTQDEHGGWISSDGNTRYHGDGGPMEYSTDIAAAWRVADHMTAEWLGVRVVTWNDVAQASILKQADHDEVIVVCSAEAPTAPHAICLAALRAVGVEV
jgi:hypothetical protein